MFKGTPFLGEKKNTFCPFQVLWCYCHGHVGLGPGRGSFCQGPSLGGEDFWVGTVRAYEAEAQREKPGEIPLLRPKFREASVQKRGLRLSQVFGMFIKCQEIVLNMDGHGSWGVYRFQTQNLCMWILPICEAVYILKGDCGRLEFWKKHQPSYMTTISLGQVHFASSERWQGGMKNFKKSRFYMMFPYHLDQIT